MLPQLVTEIPGPRSREFAGRLRRVESRNITFVNEGWPVFWERAEGTNVWDVDGNRFLDFTSAFGVAGLGHTNPAIREALSSQSEKLFHAMGDVHPSELKVRVCEALSGLTFERWNAGAGKCVLGNSGFEAVEVALKTSMLHSGKPGVIAFTGGYHGLGFGAVAAGGIPFFREPFRAQLKEFAALIPYPNCFHCPYGVKETFRLEGDPFPNCATGCLTKLHDEIMRTIHQRDIGCILVEPVQGRGGIVVPPRDFLPMLRRICDEEKILLIVDEIYTGFNRTGALFACDHSGVAPDIICLGKGLTGGFPLSACVGRADIMDAWPESQGEALHTSTFLGNPLGCAMALASIKQHVDPGTASMVRQRGGELKKRLLQMQTSVIGNIRGIGLMIGMELIAPDGRGFNAGSLISRVLADGLLLLADGPASNVLAFTPPFSIAPDEIAFAANRVQEYLTSLPGSIS